MDVEKKSDREIRLDYIRIDLYFREKKKLIILIFEKIHYKQQICIKKLRTIAQFTLK